MRLSRADRSLLSEWWLTIDRGMLFAILLLMAFGLMLSLAASPAIAIKHGFEPFYFVKRHIIWFIPGLFLLLFISLMSPAQMRRMSFFLFLISVTLMIFVLLSGAEVNGAKRWLRIANYSLQPSEFAKPAFVILVAWLFSESEKRPDIPTNEFSHLLYFLFAFLLLLQPDFGQTLLVTLVWGGLFFLSGVAFYWIVILLLLLVLGIATAYFIFPHVAQRIDRFVDPSSGDTYQTDRAIQSFIEGSWFGRGPGEGQLKRVLPDSHTDFTFAVVGEEFGILICLILLILFAFIVLKALTRAMHDADKFSCYATTGLAMLFGLQASINMAVNIGLLPAKGMTLPFVSYGGSSLLGLSIAMGMVLGLTRRRVNKNLSWS